MTEMTLNDLRVGDIVMTRNEEYFIVLSIPKRFSENGLALFSKASFGCYAYLSDYNQDLTYCK